MGANDYLQLRRGRWFVRIRLPSDLAKLLGRTHIVRSLGTSDLAVARQRRRAALAAILTWQASQTVLDDWTPARAWRTVTNGSSDAVIPFSITPRMNRSRRQPSSSTSSKPMGNAPAKVGKDRVDSLKMLLERWLAENPAGNTQQTLAMHRVAMRPLLAKHSTLLPNEVTRRVAGDFVSEMIAAEASQKTVNRKLSSISSFWRWMEWRGFVEQNPWGRQGAYAAKPKRFGPKKRAYSAAELVTLLGSTPEEVAGERYGTMIRDLMRLGLLTGCRIGELCAFRVEDVMLEARAVRIPEGKTENARRVVPIHNLIWPIIVRRAQAAHDGWLFPDLTPGGPDGKRSWFVVKRFSSFRQATLGEDKAVDFHSFRRTFATYLERASVTCISVNTSTIAELMGHSKPTLALAVYSSGLVPAQLRAAIDALDAVIEAEVAALIAS